MDISKTGANLQNLMTFSNSASPNYPKTVVTLSAKFFLLASVIEHMLQQEMLPKLCMKDRYGVLSTNNVGKVYCPVSTHAVGKHCTKVTIPIFHALLGQHSSLHHVFDNQENSSFTQLLVLCWQFPGGNDVAATKNYPPCIFFL